MTSYKQLEKRPAPTIGNNTSIKRVIGGYVIEIDGMTAGLKYWKPLVIICKSFSEVLLILKDWEHSPEELNNDR